MSSLKRHFTAVVGSKENGLYISASPSSAARKIVSKLCASSKSKKVEFCVREITQGSKKKTYGPYLGEMKKLAKPIELKGRVIRFDIKVHLKKKKTATKTGKKIGKKMMGGYVKLTGIPSVDDFLIRKIPMELFEKNTIHIQNNNMHTSVKHYNDLEETQDVKVITNVASQEPYLFFYPEAKEMSHASSFVHPNYRYYQYLAFNSGFGNSKKAIFKKLGYIKLPNDRYDKNIEDVVNISTEIPKKALTQLRNFILDQRQQDPTFCKTIYNAVVAVVGEPQQNE
jgi:hypothetical protein